MNSFGASTKSVASSASSHPGLIATAAAAVGLAATAAWVEVQARRAERDHPPEGEFIDIDGVDLHYVERGDGPPVVLLHGNAVTQADFNASGLMDRLARQHRVIAFDRPGFGHSTRPRDRLWTPAAQAELLHGALERLSVEQPVLVGHSMGTLVAMAMALNYPQDVRGLVLLGGYYYPSLRLDALLTAPVALPVLGDVMRYTVTALSSRALLGKMAKGMFSPRDVPANFFPEVSREMMLRPVQLRANAEDAAFMIPAAKSLSSRYHELTLPITLIAGEEDQVVSPDGQTVRLHEELPHSELHGIRGTGHMAHYVAQELIVQAVDEHVQTVAQAVSLGSHTSMTRDDLSMAAQLDFGRR
ncbi:MAG: alpha/beta hydrolase [Polaromonas sp.]|nr:alpha/beta hydrolase [Polaromonas sp.]